LRIYDNEGREVVVAVLCPAYPYPERMGLFASHRGGDECEVLLYPEGDGYRVVARYKKVRSLGMRVAIEREGRSYVTQIVKVLLMMEKDGRSGARWEPVVLDDILLVQFFRHYVPCVFWFLLEYLADKNLRDGTLILGYKGTVLKLVLGMSFRHDVVDGVRVGVRLLC